ncbi:LOW QUALITY PROTEIN: uncharacterized protein ACR2FA_011440 [Aphomia sociella]
MPQGEQRIGNSYHPPMHHKQQALLDDVLHWGQARCAAPPPRHSTTTRRSAHNMPAVTQLLSLRLLCLLVAVVAEPAPGRVPKVYNALITSNQNLEPSKAYPVYQPVLHETISFPFQPSLFYGDFPLNNGLQPPALPRKEPVPNQPPLPQPTPQEPVEKPTVIPPPEPTKEPQSVTSTAAPPPPPNTESPIPLNEFGLPPQVIPLGRIDPSYEGFSQVGPFTYSYPSFRLYDPFDPFSLSPFVQLPSLYRPLPNILRQSTLLQANKEVIIPTVAPPTRVEQSGDAPPPEPIDLNLLNYSSKDPAIPNVPPPPLPQSGIKTDKSE